MKSPHLLALIAFASAGLVTAVGQENGNEPGGPQLVIGPSRFAGNGSEYPADKGQRILQRDPGYGSEALSQLMITKGTDGKSLEFTRVTTPRGEPFRLFDTSSYPIAYSPTTGLLACTNSATVPKGARKSEFRTLNIWDLNKKKIIYTGLKGEGIESRRFAFGPDGKLLVNTKRGLEQVDPENKKITLIAEKCEFARFAANPNQFFAFKADADGEFGLVILEYGTWKERLRIPGIQSFYAFGLSPAGDRLVGVDGPGKALSMWDARTGKPMPLPAGPCRLPAAFSPDGKLLVCAEEKEFICVVSLDTPRRLGGYKLDKEPTSSPNGPGKVYTRVSDIYGVAFTPSGKALRVLFESRGGETIQRGFTELDKRIENHNYTWQKLQTIPLSDVVLNPAKGPSDEKK